MNESSGNNSPRVSALEMRAKEAKQKSEERQARKNAKIQETIANRLQFRPKGRRQPAIPASVSNTPKRPRMLTVPSPQEQEFLRTLAIRDEFHRKRDMEVEEQQKTEEHLKELGRAVASLRTADLVKPETVNGLISRRGEDLASNVIEGLAQIKHQLGILARGTIFSDVSELASFLLGISRSSVSERSSRLVDPKAARVPKKAPSRKEAYIRAVAKLTAEDRNSLFQHLQESWKEERHVTLDNLLEWAKDTIGFSYGKTILCRALHGMGLCFKLKNHNSVIEEKEELRRMRETYLRRKAYHLEWNSFFGFFDETWVYEGMVCERGWQMRDTDKYRRARLVCIEEPVPGPQKGAKRGKRGIVAAVVTENGILKPTAKIWISGGRGRDQLEDYHREMNADLCEGYMMDTVIPALAEAAAEVGRPPVLVIDNAPYHNRTIEKAPTKSSTKPVMREFMVTHGIQFAPKDTKAVLFEAIEQYIQTMGGRSVFKKFVIDEFAKSKGVTVLRLPPYHCFMNPIETVWSRGKRHVRSTGTTKDTLLMVRERMLSFLENFSAEESLNLFHNVLKDEDEIRQMGIQKKLEAALAKQREEELDLRELAVDDDDLSAEVLPSASGPSSSSRTLAAVEEYESEIEWTGIDDADVEMADAFDQSDGEMD